MNWDIPWHSFTVEEIERFLQTNIAFGLSKEEAKKRLVHQGENISPEEWQFPRRRFVKEVLHSILPIFISILFYIDKKPTLSVIFFVGGVLYPVFRFYFTEITYLFLSLKERFLPRASVLRDGGFVSVPVTDIVVGDVLELLSGDRVPANVRIFCSFLLTVDESNLFEGKAEVFKSPEPLAEDTPPGQQRNMLFAGTQVKSGRALGIVVATGENTMLGHLPQYQYEKPKAFSTIFPIPPKVYYSVMFVILVTFFAGWVKGVDIENIVGNLACLLAATFGIIFPVPAFFAILSSFVRAGRRGFYMRYPELLCKMDSIDCICIDSDNFLLKGAEGVVSAVANGKKITVDPKKVELDELFTVDGEIFDDYTRDSLGLLLKMASLSNLIYSKDGIIWGSRKEIGIFELIKKTGMRKELIGGLELLLLERVNDVRGIRADFKAGQDTISVLKGDAKRLLNLCEYAYLNRDVYRLDITLRDKLHEKITNISSAGVEKIGFAYRITHPQDTEEKGLIFVGVLGIRYALNPQIYSSIEQFVKGGKKVVLFQEAGFVPKLPEAVAVVEKEELDTVVDRIEDTDILFLPDLGERGRLRVVAMLKESGYRLAYVGTGISDFEPMRISDISIADYDRGLCIAGEIADVKVENKPSSFPLLKDAEFSLYRVEKLLLYLFFVSLGLTGSMLGLSLFSIPYPILSPYHMVWLGLFVILPLATFLSLESSYDEKPLWEFHPFTDGLLLGALFALEVFFLFLWNLKGTGYLNQSRTLAFVLAIFASGFSIFPLYGSSVKRVARSIWRNNRFLWISLGIIALNVAVVLSPFNLTHYGIYRIEPSKVVVCLLLGIVTACFVLLIRSIRTREKKGVTDASKEV